jgi:hypothetical protein
MVTRGTVEIVARQLTAGSADDRKVAIADVMVMGESGVSDDGEDKHWCLGMRLGRLLKESLNW